MRSEPALAPKPAPRSAQASPSWFSSKAGSPLRASMPLEIMPAVTLTSPALSAGSRRPPASNSIRTSTMGIEGLSTRYTLAPLGCVHCWMGIAASAWPQHSSKPRPKILVVIDIKPLVAQARRGRARFAIRIHRLGPQHAYGELVISEVFGGDGLHLLRSDTAQALDQPVGSIHGQAL